MNIIHQAAVAKRNETEADLYNIVKSYDYETKCLYLYLCNHDDDDDVVDDLDEQDGDYNIFAMNISI